VSDPYEEPRDADLVLDTSTMTSADAVAAVVKLLTAGGWLPEATVSPDPRSAGRPGAGRTGVAGPAVRRL